MGILGALSTAVSGLAAQSYALENISGNIANSSTIGYKRVNTSFVDFVAKSSPRHETAGSVVSFSSLTNTLQGTSESTGVATNMALSGDGFFAVSRNTGSAAVPAFTGGSLYTRRGDFTTDASGHLVNGAGYFLDGTSFNPATGAVTSPATAPVTIPSDSLPATATTSILYSGNLPTVPKPGSYSGSATGSGSVASEAFTPLSAGQTSTFTIDGVSVSLANTAGTGSSADYTFTAPGASTSVTIGGQAITVGTADTVATMVTAINASGGTVTASSVGGKLRLVNNAVGTTAVTAPTDATIFAPSGSPVTGTAADDSGSTAVKAATKIQAALTAASDTALTVSTNSGNVVFTRTAHDSTAAPVPTAVTGTNPFGAATTTAGTSDASYLIKASFFDATVNPVTGTGANQAVIASDNTAFINQTIDGGQILVYDSTGTPSTLQMRWAKINDNSGGATPSEWKLFYQSDSTPSAGAVQWSYAGTANFDATGAMTSPSSPPSFTINGLTIDGTHVGDVSIDLSKGLTQYNDANGTASSTLTQNGSTIGTLASVAVSSDGIVTGTYSNGHTAKLAIVTIAHFAAPDALKTETGGAFSETVSSGSPSYGLGNTTLVGGSVEQSNTDISDEFSKMIVTQQAYSANTKVMSTAQTMLQDVINIIR